MAEFFLLLFLQAVLLALVLFRTGFSRKTGPVMFAPGAWFVLLFSFGFVIPQLILPYANFPLIGVDNRVFFDQVRDTVETQKFLIVFLMSFAVGFIPSCVRPPKEMNLVPISRPEKWVSILLGLTGLAAVGIILLRMNPNDPRSVIVASSIGRFLYGTTFWLTLGYIVVAAILLDRKRLVLLVALTCFFGFTLMLLGGRGRVLWPMVGIFVWGSVTGRIRVKLWKLISIFIVLGIALQALDPLLFFVRGHETLEQVWQRFLDKINFESFFLARVFDSFHNVAVIYRVDAIRPDWHYLLDGSQGAFMKTYFPRVAARGIGFPATLPGGLWLAGKYPAVVIGGAAFGVFFGILTRIYRNIRSEFELVVYCIAMPWLALVGGSYLESQMKMAAAILPGFLLALWFRKKTLRRYKMMYPNS